MRYFFLSLATSMAYNTIHHAHIEEDRERVPALRVCASRRVGKRKKNQEGRKTRTNLCQAQIVVRLEFGLQMPMLELRHEFGAQ